MADEIPEPNLDPPASNIIYDNTPVAPAAGEVVQLTPEEIAAYEQVAGPAPPPVFDPLKELTVAELAELAVKDKTFDIAFTFRSSPDLHGDAAQVQKAADALNLVKQRGFKLQDLPTLGEAGGVVWQTAKGFGQQLWNYANAAGNIVQSAVADLVGDTGISEASAAEVNRRFAGNIAGTEEAMTGLAQLGEKILGKTGRAIGVIKTHAEKTPEERVADLFADVGRAEVSQQRLTGKGVFTQAVTRGTAPELNPEETATLAAGDPFAFYLFGRAAGGVSALVPRAARTAVATGLETTSTATRVVGGRVLQAAGKTVGSTAGLVEKAAPVVAPIAGAVKGGTLYGPPGVVGGFIAGERAGKLFAGGARKVGAVADDLADIGKQIASSAPVKSAYAQGGRDFLQALPGATYEVAKGTALDLGLAAASAEMPAETAAAIGFGTVLGTAQGAARIGGRVISGQLIAPREYGVSTPQPSSKAFATLDVLHNETFAKAEPGVKARLNAMRQFVSGVAPGADVFFSDSPAKLKTALEGAGLSPEQAQLWSQQNGFFTTALPDASGQPRKVIVVTRPDSAPHEALHIIQDVIGEQGNQVIDRLVKENYAGQWDKLGTDYANRLGAEPGATWQETILDATGKGMTEAKDKIYRDVYNTLEGQYGAAPSRRLVESLAKESYGRIMDEAVAKNPQIPHKDVAAKAWREVLSPAESRAAADTYMAREIAADNFDAIFKHTGPSLGEPNSFPSKLARIVGRVVVAFGGEPLAGRTGGVSSTPLSTPVVEAVRRQAAGLRPEIEVLPAGPFPRGKGTPAEEARKIADEAPTTPTERGTMSQREMLGAVAESIAAREGVKINYLSAPDEPAAATTSNRESRRAIIETFRGMPAAARALWEKTFFPERVRKTQAGKYQVFGWAPEVFAANAHKMASFLITHPELSPYAIDSASRSFTPAAWQELYRDTQTFVQNQKAGQTGSGEPLVVPKSMTDRGFTAPASRAGEAVPLLQNKADFINMLFNAKLPETPRIQKGKTPLNIAGQEVSAATLPGRVGVPVRPRGEYTGTEAERQGIAGREIAEVNPLRNQIEAAALADKKPMPSLIEANQMLNLENIKELERAPEQPEFRANTLTLQAGFEPGEYWVGKGKVNHAKDGHEAWASKKFSKTGSEAYEAAETAGYLRTVIWHGGEPIFVDPSGKYNKWTDIPKADRANIEDLAFENNKAVFFGSEEVIQKPRGLEQSVQFEPTDELPPVARGNVRLYHGEGGPQGGGTGGAFFTSTPEKAATFGNRISYVDVPQATATAAREAARKTGQGGDTSILTREDVARAKPIRREVESVTYDLDAAFDPKAAMEKMKAMTDEEWQTFTAGYNGENGGKLTGFAYDTGANARSADDLQAFRSTAALMGEVGKAAMAVGQFDKAMSYMTRAQAAGEAYEAATGTRLDGTPKDVAKFIREHYNPSFEYPMASAESKAAEPLNDVHAVADAYADEAGIDYKPKRTFAKAPESLLKRVSDFYETAQHAPTDPAVAESYGALARETEAQYNSIIAAGYKLEPFTGKGEPYKTSADMVRDVRENKHLFYLPTAEAYGAGAEAKNNLMLDSSSAGVPVNDLFRAVHDFFGHAKEGYQFGPRGEFNAWKAHSELYSPEAQGALASETLAQNAFVNFGPHMRTPEGKIRIKGESGFLGATERPFAEQKNVVVPSELLREAGAVQFEPKAKATKQDLKFKGGKTGFTKSWILPDGKAVQLGGTWHHEWLSENSDIAKKYNLVVPKFEGGDAEGVREAALKKGFVRINLNQNTGGLVVEARAKDWRKQKNTVQDMVEKNLDSVDKMTVTLLDDSATKVVDSQTASLFNLDTDAEKMAALPFISTGEVRGGQFEPVGKRFEDEGFAAELMKIRSGQEAGQTFNTDGTIWSAATGEKMDIVTLASVNVPQGKLTPETFKEALAPYADLLDEPTIKAGVFSFSQEGKPNVSIDINAVVPQEFRKNSLEFAKANDQVAIWDAVKNENVETGGKGNTRLTKPNEILDALDALTTGEPVDIAEIKRQYAEGTIGAVEEQGLLFAGEKEFVGNVAVANMTKAQLAETFPEVVIPRRRSDSIPSGIVESPLFKQAGSEEKAVNAFARRLVEFRNEYKDDPAFKAGQEWYSNFVPKLRKEFGKDAQIMAELLAATSPQTNVQVNFAYAFDALQSLKTGRFDGIIKKFNEGLKMLETNKWLKEYDKMVAAGGIPKPPSNPTPAAFIEGWINKHDLKPRQSNGALYGTHSLPVLQVLARKWLTESRGPKTLNFVKNMIGEGHEATIDLWADRTMRRVGYSGFKNRWRILPGNIQGVSAPDFAFAQKAFRKAAEELNMQPDALQGALWFAEKKLWHNKGWGRLDLGNFQAEMTKIPMLRVGFKQRVEAPKRKATEKAAETGELFTVEPRKK